MASIYSLWLYEILFLCIYNCILCLQHRWLAAKSKSVSLLSVWRGKPIMFLVIEFSTHLCVSWCWAWLVLYRFRSFFVFPALCSLLGSSTADSHKQVHVSADLHRMVHVSAAICRPAPYLCWPYPGLCRLLHVPAGLLQVFCNPSPCICTTLQASSGPSERLCRPSSCLCRHAPRLIRPASGVVLTWDTPVETRTSPV